MQSTMDPEILDKWIGKTETMTDTIRPQPANLMEMTLDRDPVLGAGDALPPLWHWLYFLSSAKISELGRDGHPALGGFLPPVALPRRMWAGGRLGFQAPLRIGCEATKVSTVKNVMLKQGRTGALCFVTVRHEIRDTEGPCLWEEHDIVYREDPKSGEAAPPPPRVQKEWDYSETVTPSEVVLFRYSALTFNGHRIHYDRDYATGIEGHGGLVVHGPLIATLLADLALRRNPGRRMAGFDFRAVSPVYNDRAFTLHASSPGNEMSLAAATADDALAMQATARF